MSIPELRASTLAIPILDTVISVNGSQAGVNSYVRAVSFNGFTITQTRVTYLEQFEVLRALVNNPPPHYRLCCHVIFSSNTQLYTSGLGAIRW